MICSGPAVPVAKTGVKSGMVVATGDKRVTCMGVKKIPKRVELVNFRGVLVPVEVLQI